MIFMFHKDQLKYWAVYETPTNEIVYWGSIKPGGNINSQTKLSGYARAKVPEKIRKGYAQVNVATLQGITLIHTLSEVRAPLKSAVWEGIAAPATVTNPIKLMAERFRRASLGNAAHKGAQNAMLMAAEMIHMATGHSYDVPDVFGPGATATTPARAGRVPKPRRTAHTATWAW